MLLAPFKTFDLCSEENTSKVLLQLSPITRSLSCSWLQCAIMLPGNSFANNSAYTTYFRNLPIIVKTSDTYSEFIKCISGLTAHPFRITQEISWIHEQLQQKVNFGQNILTFYLINEPFVCSIMKIGRLHRHQRGSII